MHYARHLIVFCEDLLESKSRTDLLDVSSSHQFEPIGLEEVKYLPILVAEGNRVHLQLRYDHRNNEGIKCYAWQLFEGSF